MRQRILSALLVLMVLFGIGGCAQKPSESQQLYETKLSDAAAANNWTAVKSLSQEILASEPSHVGALNYLGWAYAETAEWEKAVKVLEKASKLDAQRSDTYVNLGWAYAELGQWEPSLTASQNALALVPENPYVHANLGWAYTALEQLDMAEQHYQKAIELKPDLYTAYRSLGEVVCGKGEVEKARAIAFDLKTLSPDLAKQLEKTIGSGCQSNYTSAKG